LLETISEKAKKIAASLTYKTSIGFTHQDDRDEDYTPPGHAVSGGSSPRGRSRKVKMSPSVRAIVGYVEKEREPERKSPRLRDNANRFVSAVEGCTNNNVDSDDGNTPSEAG
jgi:hypothetical protein